MRPVYSERGTPWLRACAWAAAGCALLALGLAGAGFGVIAFGSLRSGVWPNELQRSAWSALFAAVLRQALLPQLLWTAAGWLAIARVAPALDRSWRRLAPGLLALAALGFPIVARGFTAWSPAGPADMVGTAVLVGGSAAAALLIPRALIPALGPGAFARPPMAK